MRREIIATELANRIVNRIGLIHPFELAEEEGASLDQVASAFACAEHLFGLGAIWMRLESARMPEVARVKLFDRAAAAITDHMADLLRAAKGPIKPSALVAELGPRVRDLADGASDLLAEEARSQSARMRDNFMGAGAPAAEAAMVAKLFDLDGAIGIGQLAQESRTDVLELTRAFVDLGARLGLDWAQHIAARMNPSDTWERLLVNGLARDFQQMRLDFLRHRQGRKIGPVDTVNHWADEHTVAIAQFRAMVARAQSAVQVSPVMLAQIAGQARNLLAR